MEIRNYTGEIDYTEFKIQLNSQRTKTLLFAVDCGGHSNSQIFDAAKSAASNLAAQYNGYFITFNDGTAFKDIKELGDLSFKQSEKTSVCPILRTITSYLQNKVTNIAVIFILAGIEQLEPLKSIFAELTNLYEKSQDKLIEFHAIAASPLCDSYLLEKLVRTGTSQGSFQISNAANLPTAIDKIAKILPKPSASLTFLAHDMPKVIFREKHGEITAKLFGQVDYSGNIMLKTSRGFKIMPFAAPTPVPSASPSAVCEYIWSSLYATLMCITNESSALDDCIAAIQKYKEMIAAHTSISLSWRDLLYLQTCHDTIAVAEKNIARAKNRILSADDFAKSIDALFSPILDHNEPNCAADTKCIIRDPYSRLANEIETLKAINFSILGIKIDGTIHSLEPSPQQLEFYGDIIEETIRKPNPEIYETALNIAIESAANLSAADSIPIYKNYTNLAAAVAKREIPSSQITTFLVLIICGIFSGEIQKFADFTEANNYLFNLFLEHFRRNSRKLSRGEIWKAINADPKYLAVSSPAADNIDNKTIIHDTAAAFGRLSIPADLLPDHQKFAKIRAIIRLLAGADLFAPNLDRNVWAAIVFGGEIGDATFLKTFIETQIDEYIADEQKKAAAEMKKATNRHIAFAKATTLQQCKDALSGVKYGAQLHTLAGALLVDIPLAKEKITMLFRGNLAPDQSPLPADFAEFTSQTKGIWRPKNKRIYKLWRQHLSIGEDEWEEITGRKLPFAEWKKTPRI